MTCTLGITAGSQCKPNEKNGRYESNGRCLHKLIRVKIEN
jgi:hypothetical protein